jgi:hypothetical protein
MFSVLAMLGTRSDLVVVGGGISVLLGLVGFSLLLALVWQSIPEPRRTRHRLRVVSSALLVAIGGFVVLGVGITAPLANWNARYASGFRVQSAEAPKAHEAEVNHAHLDNANQEAPSVDLNAYLVDRDVFFQRLPARYVQNRRAEYQTNLLETYKKDPEGFLKRYAGVARTFLFDGA